MRIGHALQTRRRQRLRSVSSRSLVRELRDLVHVAPDRLGERRELERQHVGVGQAQHDAAADLRQRHAVGEAGVAEARVVVEGVVDRVVDAVRPRRRSRG